MGVPLPKVTSAFFCMGLETGTKIIAGLHVLCSFVIMVLSSWLAERFRDNIGTVEDEDLLYSHWYTITVLIAVFTSVHVLLGATLMVGTLKRKPVLILVWILTMLVLMTASLLFVVVVLALYGPSFDDASELIISLFEGFLFFGTVFYCIICVNSFHVLLKSSEDMDGRTWKAEE